MSSFEESKRKPPPPPRANSPHPPQQKAQLVNARNNSPPSPSSQSHGYSSRSHSRSLSRSRSRSLSTRSSIMSRSSSPSSRRSSGRNWSRSRSPQRERQHQITSSFKRSSSNSRSRSPLSNDISSSSSSSRRGSSLRRINFSSPNRRQSTRRRRSRSNSRTRSSSRSPPDKGGNYNEYYRRRSRNRYPERSRKSSNKKPTDVILIQDLLPRYNEEDIESYLLGNAFRSFEAIRILRDAETGRSRGYALVKFQSKDGAANFVRRLYPEFRLYKTLVRLDYLDVQMDEKSNWECIHCGKVNLARFDDCIACRTDRAVFSSSNRLLAFTDGSHDVSEIPTNLLLIRDLDSSTTEKDIYDLFLQLESSLRVVGIAPSQVRLIRDKITKRSLCFAFLEYPVVELSQMVLGFVSDSAVFPTGFKIKECTPKIGYGTLASFIGAYAPGKFTLITTEAKILTYCVDTAYASGYPLSVLPLMIEAEQKESAARLQINDNDSDLAAFYAEIDTGIISSTAEETNSSSLKGNQESIKIEKINNKIGGDKNQKKVGILIEESSKSLSIINKSKTQNKRGGGGNKNKAGGGGSNNIYSNLSNIKLPDFEPYDDRIIGEDFSNHQRCECYLCLRVFRTKRALLNHITKSVLHAQQKENILARQLALFLKIHGLEKGALPNRKEVLESIPIRVSNNNKRNIISSNSSNSSGIEKNTNNNNEGKKVSGVGGKLLAKMGWSGGGLGRSGGGIVNPIQASGYSAGKGIGASGVLGGENSITTTTTTTFNNSNSINNINTTTTTTTEVNNKNKSTTTTFILPAKYARYTAVRRT